MASFNRVILAGNLTRDPELRYTPSGTAVTDLSLAINNVRGRGTDRKEETVFVDVTVWDRQAENCCEYLAKGRPVLIEGRLRQDTWEDRETGKKRSRLVVVAQNVQFLSAGAPGAGGGGGGGGGGRQGPGRGSYQNSPSEEGGQQYNAPQGRNEPLDDDFSADDVPF